MCLSLTKKVVDLNGRDNIKPIFLTKGFIIMNKKDMKIFLFVILGLISIIVTQSFIWINVGP